MSIFLFLSLFISISFAQDESLDSLQKEALSIVHNFQNNYQLYYKKQSPNISVRMVSVKELLFDDSVASCERTPKIVILVEKNMWMDASHDKREYTVLHQLGHCLLNRIHKKEKIRDIPLSIMSLNNNVKYFKKYKEEYIKELFTKDSLPFMEKIANER